MHGDDSGRERGDERLRTPRREYRHEVRPGKVVAGLVLLGIAALYLGDAGGVWVTPAGVAAPVLVAGLVAAGATSRISYGVRRRRAARRASADSTDDPASTSGDQAMR
ncbi:hypothetical protein AB0M87_11305 [Streptomyces sp. NPDC051320]|uniref:hypothetical protein n=1 Tax=Streptomyces sp. NPDC051320 TaxID=3154644 RepID=UPI00341BC551